MQGGGVVLDGEGVGFGGEGGGAGGGGGGHVFKTLGLVVL